MTDSKRLLTVLLILTGSLLALALAAQLALARRRRRELGKLTARLRALDSEHQTLLEETARLGTENRARRAAEDQAIDQRIQLVLAAVDTASGLTSSALRDSLELGMENAGVELLDPAGQPFDASFQRLLRRVPAPDASKHGIVAETIQRGYRDAGRLLRPADVAVYEHEAPVTGAPTLPPEEG